MRGFWKAAWLVPALVSAKRVKDNLLGQIPNAADIDVVVPILSESPDVPDFLSFHVEVLASEQICGYGNITINDQELSQEPVGSSSEGGGPIYFDGTTVIGSWVFSCLTAPNGPYAQQLDFSVLSVNGIPLRDVAFWIEFKQSEDLEIYSPSAVADSLASEASTYDDSFDLDNYDIEGELADLEWMKGVVEEFEYLIFLKEEAMATYLSEGSLDTCDSLKCVLKTALSKARVTAHKVLGKVYSKLSGEAESEEDMRLPWKKPHWRKPPHHSPTHGNHTHGNHTCPGKGNHSHPHFPHRRPPPPPLCRCPPPRHGHRPPPNEPPSYDSTGKPSDGSLSSSPVSPEESLTRPHIPSSWPTQHPNFEDLDVDGTQMHITSDLGELPIDEPPFSGMGSLSEFDGPAFHRKLHKIRTAIKFFVAATLLFLFIAFIHRCFRCCCSSRRRKDRLARREERRRRRAYRRAARMQAWKSWFARHIHYFTARDEEEEEEKRAALAGRSSSSTINEEEDAVASEISELSHAARIVSEMIAAEEGRAHSHQHQQQQQQGRISIDSRSSLPDYVSELGGEALPTYEDEERTELSSVVADGFRYTPGSTVYTPGSSSGGSVRDIIGDTKD